MPTPLTNDRWGYESSCFVCEKSNAHGLQIPFQLDDDGTTVSAAFRLGAQYSGAPSLVHGGLSLAVLDEAQAWAVIAVTNKWGLTRRTESSFDGAVFIDHDNEVRATIVEDGDAEVRTAAVLLDHTGTEVVRSTATFTVVGVIDEAQAALGLTKKHQDRLLQGRHLERDGGDNPT